MVSGNASRMSFGKAFIQFAHDAARKKDIVILLQEIRKQTWTTCSVLLWPRNKGFGAENFG